MKQLINIILILSISVTGCSNNKPMEKEKKYDYSAGSSSAMGYPCEIPPGCYIGEARIAYGTVYHEWGAGSSSMFSGPDMKSVPDSIRLTYYSYTEDKFYTLREALPKEDIGKLLDAEYQTLDGKTERYNLFEVSVAPGGFVAVWLGFGPGSKRIGVYQAQEADLEFGRVFRDRTYGRKTVHRLMSEKLFWFVRGEIERNELPYGYWKDLEKTYPWKMTFKDPGFEAYNFGVDLVNAEAVDYFAEKDWLTELQEKPIPEGITFYIKHDLNPIRYKVAIYLADHARNTKVEEEIYREMNQKRRLKAIFDSFYSVTGNEEVSLMVEFDQTMKLLKLKLISENHVCELEDIRYKIFDSEQYNLNK